MPVALLLSVDVACLHGGVGTAFLQILLELHLCSVGFARCFSCERFLVLICALVGFSSRSMSCKRAAALSLVTQQGKFILWICLSAWRDTNPRANPRHFSTSQNL